MQRTPPEGQPWSLDRVQEVYPWPAGWTARGKLSEILWTFELELPREALWAQVSDTSAINRGLALPHIDFCEVEGKLHAVTGSGLARSEWVEQPWQWEYGRWMSYERVYSKGLAHYIRTLNVFEEPEPGKTKMIAYTGAVVRSWFGAKLFSAYMRRLESRYHALLQQMVALARGGSALGRQSVADAVSEQGRARVEAIRARLIEAGEDAGAVAALIEHVRSGDELELHRLRVRPLARRFGIDQDALLSAALAAAAEGLLLLRWDVVCPHCRGLRSEIEHLGEVPSRGSCEPCGVDFDTADAEVMEITFRVHPRIRDVPERVYCAAEPATKHHIRVQRVLAPGERYVVDSLLPRGRYRTRVLGQAALGRIEVGGARPEGELEPGGEVSWRAGEALVADALGPRPSLALINDADVARTFVIEEHERDVNALRPADVFAEPAFRRHFAAEHLGLGVALDVGVQTILFTDVVGSTRFYLDAGDAAAFAEIRKQFVLAYPVVERHDGVVVKTIGDAIMGAFRNPVDAVAAAIDLQRTFDGERECSLRIRVTCTPAPAWPSTSTPAWITSAPPSTSRPRSSRWPRRARSHGPRRCTRIPRSRP
jgi:hypothetical protein